MELCGLNPDPTDLVITTGPGAPELTAAENIGWSVRIGLTTA